MAIFLLEELFGCGQWAKPEAALGILIVIDVLGPG
jgi:hypothetical protein